MEPHHEQRQGVAVAIVTYAVWGVLTIYWKQLHQFDAFELIGWRVLTSAATMVVILTATRRWPDVRRLLRPDRQLATLCLAAVLLAVNWTSYVWAVVNDHVLETALGYFISPLGTVAVGVVLMHEPMRRAQKIAVALAAAAVLVLTISYGKLPLMALLIAASWTMYGYLKRRIALTPMESMSAESFVLLAPAVIVVVALAGRGDSIPSSATSLEWAFVLGTGLATVVPLMTFSYAARRVPLTVIGPMQYSVPTINFLIGWLMYDEPMPTDRLIGFGLVWIGLLIVTLDSTFRSRRTT